MNGIVSLAARLAIARWHCHTVAHSDALCVRVCYHTSALCFGVGHVQASSTECCVIPHPIWIRSAPGDVFFRSRFLDLCSDHLRRLCTLREDVGCAPSQVVVKAQEFEASKVAHAFQIPPLEQMAKVREASKFSKGEMSISERMPKKDDRS